MKRLITLFLTIGLLIPVANARGVKEQAVKDTTDISRKLMRFTGNIHQFNDIFPQEKVYLEFDNTAYFQGEVIWFKAFVTHATTLKRAPSKVLYVDLLAPTGQVVEKKKLKVIAGQADGAFLLWDAGTAQTREKYGIMEYPSGFYEIRAYTQNMLDFSQSAIFSRVVPVYTKPRRVGDFNSSEVILDDDNPLTYDIRKDADEDDNKVNVSFFPEGGDLVSGLPCNVAFKATDKDGYELEGALVYGDGGDTAYTLHDGMGMFSIVPKGAETVLFVTQDGKKTRFSLPKALKSGYSMTTLARSDSLLKVSISCTPDLEGEPAALTVTCRGDVVYFREIDDKDSSRLDIDCSSWPIGVCRMTLYNQNGRILSSRSIFHNNAMFKSPSIWVTTDSLSREPFSKEVVKFKLTDKDGNPIRDRFCVSVRDVSDYGNGLTENLQTNLLLSSDLKGYIHDPAWYLAENDALHRDALNLLTLVQGWERYEWKYMTGQTYFRERHRIEDSLTMNGWILSYVKREPVEGVEVLASVQPLYDKTKFETFQYDTDSTGYYGFDLADFYGKAKMTVNLMRVKRNGKSKHEKRTRIRFERSDKPAPKPYLKQEIDLTRNKPVAVEPDFTDDGLPLVIREDLGVVLEDVDITEKRQFVDYDTFTSFNVEEDAEMELDLGEYTTDVEGYFLERGIRFLWKEDLGNVMELESNDQEVEQNGGWGTWIWDVQKNRDLNIYPYFYVHNNEKELHYKPFDRPLQIDMIDVKSIIVFDKPMTRREIVQFTPLATDYHSKHLDVDWFTENETDWQRYYLVDIQIKDDRELLFYNEIRDLGRRSTTIDGFSKPVEYYSPQYPEGPVYGDVDLRRTVFWDANVITDDEGNARVEFYNNSFSRRFTISGAGITASGIPYVLNQNW